MKKVSVIASVIITILLFLLGFIIGMSLRATNPTIKEVPIFKEVIKYIDHDVYVDPNPVDCKINGVCTVVCEKEYHITISPQATKKLHDYYIASDGKEYGACVVGTIRPDGSVEITDTDTFTIGSVAVVTVPRCTGQRYIGMIHKHTDGMFKPSMGDVLRWDSDFKNDHLTFAFIHYDFDTVSIKTSCDWYNGRSIALEGST